MSASYLSTVTGTPGNTAGLTLVEQYLDKSYLSSQEFETPLAQTKYLSQRNIPKMAGQYIKLTRRSPTRLPEVAKESTDPLSYADQKYEQINIPIEWVNDHYAISKMAQDTSWIDLAKDAKEEIFVAMRRYLNRTVQAAMLGGRYKPGYRNSSGVTVDGDSTYPSPWYEEESTVTLYGGSYTFLKFPQIYANGVETFAALTGVQKPNFSDLRKIRVRLMNRGAKKFNGKFVAVVSDAVIADLEVEDELFQAAIRNQAQSNKLFAGEIVDYAGFHFVREDEPWTMKIGDGGVKKAANDDGEVHVCQIFGMDAAAFLKLGGEKAVKPSFKVQNISTTGKVTTIGFCVPHQVAVTNENWGVNYLCCPRYFNA